MVIEKIEREKLKNLLFEVLSHSATFKYIDGVNPCRISFDGVEYYVYIKNLSPAQLSNNNPDIWRIQLPIRDIFEEIKKSPLPFILLGYDAQNDIYTTWNPHWAKQRLNLAKSVSFYSRLTIQEKAREIQQFQHQTLHNEGEVFAFPREKISYFLVNMQIFFPDMSEYVAMGSRKRTEANEAYKTLNDNKHLPDFAHYLAYYNLSDKTMNNYCHAIRKLINDGYFSRNRKIFLAFDSVADYPNAIKPFFEVPEVKEINDIWHNTYSAALNYYLKFLIEISNVISGETATEESNEAFNFFCNIQNLGNFMEYLCDKELSERSIGTYTNAICKLIKEQYFYRYRDTFLAYENITDYSSAIDEFIAIPEITAINLSWKYVFSAALKHYVQFLIEWGNTNANKSPIPFTTEIEFEPQLIDEITNTDEEPAEFEIEETDWETQFTDEQGKLTRIANPTVLNLLRPVLDTEYKSTAAAYNIIGDFYDKRLPDMEIKDWQKLFDKINWSNPYFQNNQFQKTNYISSMVAEPDGKRKSHILRVTFPDGSIIQERIVSKTLIEVIKRTDPELISEMNICLAGVNLVSKKVSDSYEKYQVAIDNGYYVMTLSSTPKKQQILETISETLDLGLLIEQIPIEDLPFQPASPKPYPVSSQPRAKVRVTFPNGHTLQENQVQRTLFEIVKYAGAEKVRSLGIIVNGDNLVTPTINPKYEKTLKPIENGLYVNTQSNTQTKFSQIQQISEELNLGLIVELV